MSVNHASDYMRRALRLNRSPRGDKIPAGELSDPPCSLIPSEKSESQGNGKDNGRLVASQERDPDFDLVKQYRAGNRQAFDLLVLRHKDRLYTLASHLLGDWSEAEDITQETFVRAYGKLDEFRGEAKLSTWLYRICHNLCLTRLGKNKDRLGDEAFFYRLPDTGTEPSEQFIAKERQKVIQWALSQLKPAFREVLVLYHQEHLPYEEIADVLDLPVGTIRSRLHRGREEMKELLRPYLAAA